MIVFTTGVWVVVGVEVVLLLSELEVEAGPLVEVVEGAVDSAEEVVSAAAVLEEELEEVEDVVGSAEGVGVSEAVDDVEDVEEVDDVVGVV